MTYIAPNSTIKLIKNCPLSNNYEHTLYFSGSDTQYSYFSGLDGSTLNNQMYTRTGEGKFRCSLPMSSVYNVNYMMFKNTDFENFWFYAFVTHIEYVNNGLCELYFELDYIQTWFIQKLNLKQCFVEREHTATDNIGDSITPEPVATGEYVFNNYTSLAKIDHDTYENVSQFAIIVAVCDTTKDVGANGKLYDGVYGGATLYAYRQGDKAGVNNKINEYVSVGKADSIISIYLTPQYFVEWYLDDSTHKVGETTEGRTITYTPPKITTSDTLDGWKPRNNKCYTYPYNFLQVDNSNGSSLILRYEFFKDLIPKLRFSGTITPPVTLMVRPKNYKNIGNPLCSETLTITSFPVCSWNYDAYQAWFAQSGYNIGVSTVSNIAGGAVTGAMTGGAVGAAVGAGLGATQSIFNILQQDNTASLKADVLSGNFNSGNANFSVGEQGFNLGRVSVSKQMARRIDEFFDTYGYAVGRTKTPNISNRPHWNYVKTVQCKVRGSAPADAIAKVESIFDKGLTFWKNPSEFLNYNLDNSPS